MIKTSAIRQKLHRIKKRNQISSINFGNLYDVAKKSVKETKEFSGIFKHKIVNKQLQLYISNKLSGHTSKVDVPEESGSTWHTHPRGCPSLKNCSIIPPSAADFEIFALRHETTHLVLTKDRIYYVKANKEFTEQDSEYIKNFYEVIEKVFDDTNIKHREYDDIFELASKYGEFFKIYKFKNQKVVRL